MNRWIKDYRAGKYEYNDLVEILSDYHKDVFGYRLRMWGKPAEMICFELDRIDQYVAATSEDPQQYAEDSADQDAIYYGA